MEMEQGGKEIIIKGRKIKGRSCVTETTCHYLHLTEDINTGNVACHKHVAVKFMATKKT